MQDVDTAPAIDRGLDHRRTLGVARDVGGVGGRLAALRSNRRDGLLGAVLHLVDAEDFRALAREENGRRLAVAEARAARAGAGDDRDLAVQPSAHRALTLRSAGRDSRPTKAASHRR